MKGDGPAAVWMLSRRRKFRVAGDAGRPVIVAGLLFGLLGPGAALAASTRCPDGIIDRGDEAPELRSHCGAPEYIVAWPASPPLAAGSVWFYNEGPSRLLRVLRLRAGRLVAAESAGYGFRVPERAQCEPGQARVGWTAYRLIALCGEPDAREVVGTLLTARRDSPSGPLLAHGQRAVHRQRWRYDFGSRYLPREYTLDNAIVTQVRTLSRGD